MTAQRGDRGQAESYYRQAIVLEPFDHHAHLQLASLYSADGRQADAIREYQAALETDPNNIEARKALARLQSNAR